MILLFRCMHAQCGFDRHWEQGPIFGVLARPQPNRGWHQGVGMLHACFLSPAAEPVATGRPTVLL